MAELLHAYLLPVLFLAVLPATAATPLRLHPDNPHYFLFRGKPAVLVTSGEHYGAVLNLDFDYRRYLETLSRDRLNLTRTFAGNYHEIPGSFKIERNTLAPMPGRFICPWRRTGEKFDLAQWDDAYFARLRDFMQEASKRGVVVEMNLFCPFYEDSMWDVSPMNARNNVNGVGDLKRTDALTLQNGKLLEVQDAMVRKIATELRGFDNLYYEICNEPYFGGVTREWQHHIAQTIRAAESGMATPHLISQNIGNGSMKVRDPDTLVSIFNFHYSRPPESVGMNRELNRAIGYNETGFDGTSDAAYRLQGWDYLMAGGALYNNLDYSFTVGHEEGTFQYPQTQPGGGSAALRHQLRVLREFFGRFDFLRTAPADVIRGGVPEGASARALADPRNCYAIYVHHGRPVKDGKPKYQVDGTQHRVELRLDLAQGQYTAEWVNTKSGGIEKQERITHAGGERALSSPEYREDIALLIRKR